MLRLSRSHPVQETIATTSELRSRTKSGWRCRGAEACGSLEMVACVHEGKDEGYEKERREGREDEASYDGATEGGILARLDGHRLHADDHGKSRHEHWAKAGTARLHRCLYGRAACRQPLSREADDK